jgi:carboxypeptidase Taq
VTAVAAPTALDDLRRALAEVADLQRAAAVLGWDQETCMPPGGVEDRANQLATLLSLAHERFTSPEVARLLDRAEAEVAGMAPESDEGSLVRVTRRDVTEASRLPAALVAEQARESARARPVWQEARERSDWSRFAPAMERMVDLSRRIAEAFGYPDQALRRPDRAHRAGPDHGQGRGPVRAGPGGGRAPAPGAGGAR